jgi:hypothetical protein
MNRGPRGHKRSKVRMKCPRCLGKRKVPGQGRRTTYYYFYEHVMDCPMCLGKGHL